MLKRCDISWLMGYEKEAYLYLLFHYTGKDFQESTSKIKRLMFGLAQVSYLGLWDIITQPRPHPHRVTTSFLHILWKNMRTHWPAKGLEWDYILEYFSISYMYNTKSDHFSPKIKLYIQGNRKLKAKSLKRDQQRAYI